VIVGATVVFSCGGGGQGGGTGGTGGATGTGGSGATDGGLSCAAVAPCGGDVVGTWKVSSDCLGKTEDLSSTCPGATAEITFSLSGTQTFNADLTYTATLSGGGTTTYHYPGACLTGGTNCTQWAQLLNSVGMYSEVTCATDGAGVCNCVAVSPTMTDNESGTYSVSGGTLSTAPAGSANGAPYCVQGNVLREMPTLGDGGQISGSLVFTRQ
jgi:hypothetical protein